MPRVLTRQILLTLCLLASLAMPSRASSVSVDMRVTTPGPLQQTKTTHRDMYSAEIRHSIATDDKDAEVGLRAEEYRGHDDYIHESFSLYAHLVQGASFDATLKISPPGQTVVWTLYIYGPYQQDDSNVEWKGVAYSTTYSGPFTGIWFGYYYPYDSTLHVWGDQPGYYSISLYLTAVPTPAAWTSGAILLAGLALTRARRFAKTAVSSLGRHTKDDQDPA